MSCDIAFINNGKREPYWYGCSFSIQDGTPLLMECRYIASLPSDLPNENGRPPDHVVEYIIGRFAARADRIGRRLVTYDERDLKRPPNLSAFRVPNPVTKQVGISPGQQAMKDVNALKEAMGRVDLEKYQTGMSMFKNLFPNRIIIPGVDPAKKS